MKQKNLLIISAHADDHIACAGTVFKLINEFDFQAFETVLTNSELGQNFKVSKQIDKKTVAKTRRRELTRASAFLGIKETYELGQPDLNLSYSQELMFQVVSLIRSLRPEVVFLHNNYDAHPDHIESYKIGLTAVKIAAMGVQKQTLGEPFRVPLVLCAEGMLPIKSQILVDITKYLPLKTKLFEIYSSQANSKAVAFEKSLATVRGYHLRKVDGLYAECFSLQDEFPVLLFDKGAK